MNVFSSRKKIKFFDLLLLIRYRIKKTPMNTQIPSELKKNKISDTTKSPYYIKFSLSIHTYLLYIDLEMVVITISFIKPLQQSLRT